MAGKFEEYYNKIKEKIGLFKNQSLKWLHNYAKGLKSGMIEKEAMFLDDIIGKMVMFKYDPKFKNDDKVLPYYDVYPVIFITDFKKDGFLGINLHYLDLIHRVRLMDALWSISNNEKMDKNTKLNISYQILKNSSKFSYFKPCLKRYLTKHIQTKISVVKAEHWDFVCVLPLARFMKKSESYVHSKSLEIIRHK